MNETRSFEGGLIFRFIWGVLNLAIFEYSGASHNWLGVMEMRHMASNLDFSSASPDPNI